MQKEIEITFKTDGSSIIEAKGFQGKGCEDATKPFEEALGHVTKRTKKTEYYANKSIKDKGKIRY